MKRLVLVALLFNLYFNLSVAGGTENPIALRPEILQMYRQQSLVPLEVEEKAQLITFMKAAGTIPGNLLQDIQTRGLGYCRGALREMSQEEKTFLKNNIEHVHHLKFLIFINFEHMDLTSIPDSFAELDKLGFLNLEGNKISTIPAAVDSLQQDNRLIAIALNDNPLSLADSERVRKKTMEAIYKGNAHSVVKPEDLEWNNDLIDFKAHSHISLPTEPAYKALSEIILLSALDGFEEDHQHWLASPLNCKRLAHYCTSTTPAKAIQFVADHPDELFKETFSDMDTRTQKFKLVEVVLTHLMDCELLEVQGEEIKITETLKHKIPSSVSGWTRFFTQEPVNLGEGVWFTPEGVQVLFDLIGFHDLQFANGWILEDVSVFDNFNQKYDIPFMMSEDIRFYHAIGVRGDRARPLAAFEVEWLKEHISVIPELTFLKNLNLLGLGLEDLPENFCKFDALKILYLRKNNIREITPTIEKLHDKYPGLMTNFSMNPVMEGFSGTYTGHDRIAYEKFARKVGAIPPLIDEDIKSYQSIGVVAGVRRVCSDEEKTWLRDNLAMLPQLSFLKQLNLSDMNLSYLPNSFKDFTSLDYLLLEDNEFKTIPKILAKLRVGNHNFKTYVKGNPFRKDVDQAFEKAVVLEAKKQAEDKKREAEKADRERRKLLLKQLVGPDLNLQELEWNPEFIKTLGYGPLKPIEKPQYQVREDLQNWHDYWAMPQEDAECKKIHRKALKKVKSQMALEETQHAEHLAENRAKYRHVFFECVLRAAAESYAELVASGLDFPTNIQNMTAGIADKDLIKAENKEWLEDVFNRIMLYSFFATHSPQDIINLMENEKSFLKEMLRVKKAYEPEITKEKLRDRTKNFINVLLPVLGNVKKLVPIMTKKLDDTIEIEHAGHKNYFTAEPNVLKPYKGWLTKQGIAELLVFLKIAETKE